MPKFTSCQQVQQLIKAGDVSTVKVVQYYLDQIAATQQLNIYVETWADEALETARRSSC